MNKLNENFSQTEKLLLNILLGTFLVNILVLSIIILLDGNIPIWFMFIVLPVGIYYIIIFFVYIYRVSIFYSSEHGKEVEIWRSGLGIFLAVIGFVFSFFNYMVIVVTNIW